MIFINKNKKLIQRKTCLTSAIALTTILALSVPSKANAETLHEALVFTYANNPTIQASRSALKSTNEGIVQAKTGWKPTVTVNGQLSRTSSEGETAGTKFDRTAHNPTLASIRIDQPIFRGGKTIAATKSAKSASKAGEARLDTTEQAILLQAISSYLSVINDDAILSLNKKNEEVIAKHLETTKYRFTAGEVTKTDVAQAQARLAGATAQRINAEGLLRQSIAQYESTIGHRPEEISDPLFPNDLIPSSIEEAIEIGLSDNPTIVASRHAAKSAKHEINSVRGDFMPTISMSASASRSWDQTERNSEVDTFEGAAILSYPLYQGGLASSKLRAAKFDASAAELQIESAKRNVKSSVTSAWAQLEAAKASINATKEQVDASSIALQGIKEEVKAGTRTTLDMLDAENELLNARVEHIKAVKNKKMSAFKVLTEIGGLTAENLQILQARNL
ncbi:MAG: TolC family outer membrane protein [Alphaproteobacteria bacterium]|nr:TolC family outer membrane protein [Alphaproteobacteria bacterium]